MRGLLPSSPSFATQRSAVQTSCEHLLPCKAPPGVHCQNTTGRNNRDNSDSAILLSLILIRGDLRKKIPPRECRWIFGWREVNAKIDLCVEQSICNVFLQASEHSFLICCSLPLTPPQPPPLQRFCFEQMKLCLSLLRSLFQGCGQRRSGLRGCLPLGASAGGIKQT